MAEFIFRDLCRQAGVGERFRVDSMAVSTEEIGNDIYPPAKETLRRHGIPFDHHYARQIDSEAFHQYDLIICADRSNLRAIERMFGPLPASSPAPLSAPTGESFPKLSLMMHWAGEERDVSDPWYTRDFESAFRDIYAACQGLLEYLLHPEI
jgi:protein-tyrosine phosphatase